MGQLELLYTNSFKKDTKKFKNNNLIVKKVNEVIDILKNKQKLSIKYKNHPLSGDWKDYFECHIMPDVLLIYQVIDNKYLKLIRLGSYSDLFN